MRNLVAIAAMVTLPAMPALALTVNDRVKINEIAYDPAEVPEEPYEFIELYNPGGTTAYLDGAVISDEGNNGTSEAIFQFPGSVGGTSIPLGPGDMLLIVTDVASGNPLGADYETYGGGVDLDDPSVPNLTRIAGAGVDLLLGNAGDGVVLATGNGIMGTVVPCAETVDGVTYEGGGVGDVYALSPTVCAEVSSNPGYVGSSDSLQRCPDGSDTDTGSSVDFLIAPRTPGTANLVSVGGCAVSLERKTWGGVKVLFE